MELGIYIIMGLFGLVLVAFLASVAFVWVKAHKYHKEVKQVFKDLEQEDKREPEVVNLDKEGLTLLEEIQAVEALMVLTSLKGGHTIHLFHHGTMYALTLDQAKNMLDQVRIDQGMQLLIDNLKGGDN